MSSPIPFDRDRCNGSCETELGCECAIEPPFHFLPLPAPQRRVADREPLTDDQREALMYPQARHARDPLTRHDARTLREADHNAYDWGDPKIKQCIADLLIEKGASLPSEEHLQRWLGDEQYALYRQEVAGDDAQLRRFQRAVRRWALVMLGVVALIVALLVWPRPANAWQQSQQQHANATADAAAAASAASTSSAAGGNGAASVSSGDTRVWALPSFATSTSLSSGLCTRSGYSHWGIGWNFFYLHTGSADPVMDCMEKLAQLAALRASAAPAQPVVNYLYAAPPPKPPASAPPPPSRRATTSSKPVALAKGEPPFPHGQSLKRLVRLECRP